MIRNGVGTSWKGPDFRPERKDRLWSGRKENAIYGVYLLRGNLRKEPIGQVYLGEKLRCLLKNQ